MSSLKLVENMISTGHCIIASDINFYLSLPLVTKVSTWIFHINRILQIHILMYLMKKFILFFFRELSWWLSGKESTCKCRRYGFNPWVEKIPWRRKWQVTPVSLPGKSHGQKNLVGYIQSIWLQKCQSRLSD